MTRAATRHSCKWSPEVIEAIRQVLVTRIDEIRVVVDPFAGIDDGLREMLETIGWFAVYGIEIEPKYVALAKSLGRNHIAEGDALNPMSYLSGTEMVITSITYANRMNGTWVGKRCPNLDCVDGYRVVGADQPPHRREMEITPVAHECEDCDGTGYDPEDLKRRHGYAADLAAPPTEGSTAAFTFGPKWRTMHHDWFRVLTDVLPFGGGRVIINVSDHIANQERVAVTSWIISAAAEHGFYLSAAVPAPTRRMAEGQNHAARVDSEMVLLFDFPDPAGYRKPKKLEDQT